MSLPPIFQLGTTRISFYNARLPPLYGIIILLKRFYYRPQLNCLKSGSQSLGLTIERHHVIWSEYIILQHKAPFDDMGLNNP